MTRHRLLVLSDLPLDHLKAWPLPGSFPPFDVGVFADVVEGSPRRAIYRLAAAPGLAGRPIVFVPGNHEYHGGCLDEHLAAGRAASAGTRIHLVRLRRPGLAPLTFELAYWTILRIRKDGGRHVPGYRLPGGRGRTSSPILSFHPADRTATTSSGNRYVLVGETSVYGLERELVLVWLAIHDLANGDVEDRRGGPMTLSLHSPRAVQASPKWR